MQTAAAQRPMAELPSPQAMLPAVRPGGPPADAARRSPGAAAGDAIEPAAEAVPELRHVGVRLQVDRDLGRVVAEVVDRDSGEVIRQVPPEELLDLAKAVRKLAGLAVDERA